MDKDTRIDAMAKLVELLKPLSPEDRVRAIRSAMIWLDDNQPGTVSGSGDQEEVNEPAGEIGALPLRARTWMKQNGISASQLQHVFHITKEGVEIIAGVPGRNKKEQTYNAYILTGLGQLLRAGNPTFQDKEARALCESSGCYDSANHSVHIKNKGNEFTGTKDKGWTLTVPGLRRAGEIVKELSGQNRD
jgi:hypothetical protein